MSKAITIQQNGVDVDMTVDKLQVPRAGGTAYWVPEDEVALDRLTVTANGSYSAASAGKYGYGYVTVSVPGSGITGKGSDGNEHVISTDGSGDIVDTKVPSEIRIVTPPDYVGPYGDGAILSFEGLSVEAYYADGTSAGTVPFSELSFPVTAAHYDGSADPLVYGMSSDLFTDPVPCSPTVRAAWDEAEQRLVNYHFIGTGAGDGRMIGWGGRAHSMTNVKCLFASPNEGAQVSDDITPEITLSISYTHNNLKVYYMTSTMLGAWDVVPNVSEALDEGPAAWTMIYGTLTGTSGGVQIPVEWSRPGDGMVLETSFGITVIPAGGSGE